MFTFINCITLKGQRIRDYKWINMFKFILCTICKSAVSNLDNNLLMMNEKQHGRKEAWSSFWYYSRICLVNLPEDGINGCQNTSK